MEVRLQPVRDEDRDFLFRLRRETMGDYVERTWGWDERWQYDDFNARFDPSVQQLILYGDVPVGFLQLERKPDYIWICDIQITPSFQRRGIGSMVLQRILLEARSVGLPAELLVLHVNTRARRLYERLGFRAIEEEPPHTRMRAE